MTVPSGKIEKRTLTVSLVITQMFEGTYSSDEVATHTVTVPLPATAQVVAEHVEAAILAMTEQVEFFYGQFITEPEPAEAQVVEEAELDV